MRMTGFLAALAMTSAAATAASGAVFYPVNNGFETPDLGGGVGAYYYGNTGPLVGAAGLGWTFIGNGAGIAANGSAFGVSGATNGNTNPDGSPGATSLQGQAALIQGGDGTLTASGSAFTQDITLPAGTASVTFSEELRSGSGVTVNVYLDGALKGSSIPLNGGSFNSVTIPLGEIMAGSHTLGFAGNNLLGGDRTSFVDNVSITVVPEPTSLGLLAACTLGLLANGRRLRRRA